MRITSRIKLNYLLGELKKKRIHLALSSEVHNFAVLLTITG